MVIQFTRKGLFEELIDTGEKGGEGLTGAGGAAIRTSAPDRMAGQACCCTFVGTPTDDRNHSAMRGWNWESGILQRC